MVARGDGCSEINSDGNLSYLVFYFIRSFCNSVSLPGGSLIHFFLKERIAYKKSFLNESSENDSQCSELDVEHDSSLTQFRLMIS